MNATTLTRTMSALLLATAVLHVLAAVFGGAPEGMKLPVIAFGLIYGALGLWIQTGGRLAVIATVLVTLLGLTLGGLEASKGGATPSLAMLVMFLIDIVVVGAGAMYLIKFKPAA